MQVSAGSRLAQRDLGWALTLAIVFAAFHVGIGEAHAVGYLVPTRADVEPLAIRYHRVQVGVRERVAETRVEQTFTNHTDEVLEATYIFPVPEGATVSGFAMWVNGRRQEGELLDARQARTIYEQIVARMRDPGLVEHIGGNLFRARVFPIAPRSEQRVEIRFSQTLGYEGGIVHYRYPLRTAGRAARTTQDFTLSADIVSRTPIRAVYSPTHAIAVARPDEHHATLGFEVNGAILDTDFDLYYAVQDRDVGLSLLTHRAAGEDGYFLAMIAPRAEIAEREIAAKEVLFVFDTSGSMAGEKMQRAQAALDYMLARLNPTDRFRLVRFSTDVESVFDGRAAVPASAQNIARARQFASRMVPAGGTAIHPALQETLSTTRPEGASMPRIVVFLTDGMPTVGETDPGRITEDVARWAADSRVYVFGVGDDVNTTFLDALAQRTNGVGDYYRDGAELERRMSAFYDRIAYPLFTDLRVELPGLSAYDVYPRDLGHLYRGGQLLVIGRYRGEGESEVSLEGRVAGETERRSFGYQVAFPAHEERNDFLPRIWATRKIGFLLDTIRLNGERPELRQEVVALAQRFGIVTPYTSYLVVDESAIPPGLALPAPPPRLPPGGSFDRNTTYDFEDSVIEGEMDAPMADTLTTRRRGPSPQYDPAPQTRRHAVPPPAQAAQEDFRAFESARAQPAPPAEPRGGDVDHLLNNALGGAQGSAPSGGGGEAGRRLSSRLRSMREAERVDEAPTESRFVDGRTYRLVRGMWVDARYRRTMRTMRVRTGSAAYFALVRARPEVRRALTLGNHVTVVLDAERAVIVEEAAPEDVSADAMTEFAAP
jgi:Ca-activated chloride channel family protein